VLAKTLPEEDGGDELTVQSNLTPLKNLGQMPAPGSQAISSPQNGSSTPIPEIKQ
jgi:hypothetical protein